MSDEFKGLGLGFIGVAIFSVTLIFAVGVVGVVAVGRRMPVARRSL